MKVDEILKESTTITEAIPALNDIGLPPKFVHWLAKNRSFDHDLKVEELPGAPSAKKAQSSVILFVKNDETAYAFNKIDYWSRHGWQIFEYSNGEVTEHFEPTWADLKKQIGPARSGKFYSTSWGGGKSRAWDDKQSGSAADVKDRENVGHPEREDIYAYMNKVFLPKIRGQLEAMAADIFSNLQAIPRKVGTDGYHSNTDRQFLIRSRWSESARDEAIRYAEIIEQLAEDGFDYHVMKRWLESEKRLKKGRTDKYKDMDELERALHLEKTAPAKIAKSLLTTARHYHDKVLKIRKNIEKNKGEPRPPRR